MNVMLQPMRTRKRLKLPVMQKVAILFIALGQETCGEVMKYLSEFEIEEIECGIFLNATKDEKICIGVLPPVFFNIVANKG